jgi:DNA mismatch repair ATPase MutS
MGGKSSFLRMVGVCALMNQIGSAVPASAATLPIFDAIYTRFGSNDDISLDHSTFYSELTELGRILGKATSKSLVLIDELGRGTSSSDATALFAAVVKYFIQNKIPTLMTTHLHDLHKVLRKSLGKKDFSRIQFLKSTGDTTVDPHGRKTFKVDYRLAPGMATCSYGLEVAGWSRTYMILVIIKNTQNEHTFCRFIAKTRLFCV